MDLNLQMTPNTDQSHLTVLHFTVSNYLFCLDISYIKQLIGLVYLQRLPGTPPYFKGLMNYHGREISIIDLAAYLNISAHEKCDSNCKIILCHEGQHELGLIVNEVIELETIEKASIQVKALCEQDFSTFLEGAIITNHGESLLLNIVKMIAHICPKEQDSEK